MYHGLHDRDYSQDIEWDSTRDWTSSHQVYDDDTFTCRFAKQQWNFLYQDYNHNRNTLDESSMQLPTLNTEQQRAVDVWTTLFSETISDQALTNMRHIKNAMIINGVAGTGKSLTIREMANQALSLPHNQGKKVLIMAPTGKAALGCGGVTLHSKEGIMLPLVGGRGRNSAQLLRNASLDDLRMRFRSTCAVIIDEYSMISLIDLSWINSRLHQAFDNKKPFGGIPIVFVGDPGQISPVGGLSVWCTKTSKGHALQDKRLQGSMLYQGIKNVVHLTQVRRQADPIFLEFLMSLRDGKINEGEWRWLNDNCSLENYRRRGEAHRFENENCIKIFNSNKEVFEENVRSLRSIGEPINKLVAKHDCNASKTRPEDKCESLPSTLYLSINSKIMLLRNLCSSVGLVNGAFGVVKDFLYGESTHLPDYIIIEFSNYTGLPLFPRAEQMKWVPIPKSICKWGNNQEHFRESFPICLSYSLTVWKSQGMTITDAVMVNLGNTERDHGCSYVALSRVTSVTNLCIGPGVTLERLTTAISKGKKLKDRLIEDERLKRLCDETTRRAISH